MLFDLAMSIDDALTQLSDPGCDFDRIAGPLSDSIPGPLVGTVIESARNNNRSFGADATRLLWMQCGSKGQQFVKSNLGKLTFHGLRWLYLKLEDWDLSKLLARLKTIGIISDDQRTNILSECSNNQFDCPLIRLVFEKLARFTCYDAESSEDPPDYKYLIQQFCSGSAGMLHAKNVTISNLDEYDDSGWRVVVKWKNRNKRTEFETDYTGDWYDDQPVVEHLNSFATDLGLGNTFTYAGGVGQCPTYIFGPTDSTELLLNELLVNHDGTLDNVYELRRTLQNQIEPYSSE